MLIVATARDFALRRAVLPERRSGATLYWGMDGPDDIIEAVPGVRLLQWVSPFDSPTFADVSWPYRVMAKVMSQVPALRYMAQYHRYAF